MLKMKLEKEEAEFRTGFRIPDFSDAENLAKFTAWDGTMGSLPLVNFVRITVEGNVIAA